MKHYSKLSFSLIEFIMVLFILSLLFGISLSSYNRLNEVKGLESQVNTIVGLIEFTKDKALYVDKSNLMLTPTGSVNAEGDMISNQKVLEYRTSFFNSPKSLILVQALYCSDLNCSNVENAQIRKYELPSQYSLIFSSNYISFLPRKTNIPFSFNVTVKNNYLGLCKKITVSSSLVISIQDVVCP